MTTAAHTFTIKYQTGSCAYRTMVGAAPEMTLQAAEELAALNCDGGQVRVFVNVGGRPLPTPRTFGWGSWGRR